MARLFKDITEFKKYVSVNTNLEIDSIAPSISYAIDMYIIPAVGEAQLSTLEVAYNANSLTPSQTYLLEKIQPALANFSFYEYIPMAEVQVSESGIIRHENNQYKTAYQNQVKTLRQTTKEVAYNYVEALLEFLEGNEASFPQWVSSSAYTKNKQLFINTAREFEKHYPIMRGRETFRTLIPVINDVECFYILPAIGQGFFDYLKGKILNKDNFPFQEAMALNLIRKALSNFAIAEASQQGWVKFVSNGVVFQEQKTAGFEVEEKTAKNEQISIKIRKAEEIGHKYIDKLKSYLNDNISDFPSYENDTDINPVIDDCACEVRENYNRKDTGGFYSV